MDSWKLGCKPLLDIIIVSSPFCDLKDILWPICTQGCDHDFPVSLCLIISVAVPGFCSGGPDSFPRFCQDRQLELGEQASLYQPGSMTHLWTLLTLVDVLLFAGIDHTLGLADPGEGPPSHTHPRIVPCTVDGHCSPFARTFAFPG